jgi:hypothetical protein
MLRFSLTLPRSLVLLSIAGATLLGACEGCKSNGNGPNVPSAVPSAMVDPGPPTLRLYVVSNMAGALEPCGCTKDQLGGLDHLGALVHAEKGRAPNSIIVSAGPLFFMDPQLKPDRAEQDKTKAETIGRALKGLGFVAFAPAENDWAAGRDALVAYTRASGGAMLVANHAPASPIDVHKKYVVRESGPIKLAIIGVSPPPKEGFSPAGAEADAVKSSIEAAKKEGANVFIALASVGRGEAKRIADRVPELTAVIVGATSTVGEGNTPAPAAEQIEKVVVAESANHLQSVAVLDLFVRDGGFTFADATGIARSQKREELTRRIDDLRVKIAAWERDGKVNQTDLAARRADLDRITKERDALDVLPPPEKGSFFRYAVKEVKASFGADPATQKEMLAFYKKVNDDNRARFADRKPLPAAQGEASYLGIDKCTECHAPARKYWDTHPHARAYKTLTDQFKEMNLECVSCHVTGYEKPGGSTVTFVDKLKNVQCEVCHGPGSKHAASPGDRTLITRSPSSNVCTSCHHPPHVEQFDPVAKRDEVLGPGHGRPVK